MNKDHLVDEFSEEELEFVIGGIPVKHTMEYLEREAANGNENAQRVLNSMQCK